MKADITRPIQEREKMRLAKENQFIYAELDKATYAELCMLSVEDLFVTKQTAQRIKDLLKLDERTDEELVGIRNSIVREFSNFEDEARQSKDYESCRKFSCKMSMIVAVIDREKYIRGMAV